MTLQPTPKQFSQAEIDEVKSVLVIAVCCNDQDFLGQCRQVYDPTLLNIAAKQLTPEQHSQIMQWVLSSKETNTNLKKIESAQSLEQ